MAAAPRRPRPAIRRRSERRPQRRQDEPRDPVEEALLETFPASDPPSRTTPINGVGTPPRPPASRQSRK
jgi:hypothetical protein